MENIIREEHDKFDIITPAEGYRFVKKVAGEGIEFTDKFYVPKGKEPSGYETIALAEATELQNSIDYAWEQYLNKSLEEGTMVYYNGKMYKVRQTHTPLIVWKPTDVPALYLLSSLSEGTVDDPIAWESGMVCENGKYYTYGDTLYMGIRDSGDPLYYVPTDLLGNYFQKVSGGEAEEGTQDNPIAWESGMVAYNGKYYSEGGKTYLCFRDSGNALYYPISSLIGLYFNEIS